MILGAVVVDRDRGTSGRICGRFRPASPREVVRSGTTVESIRATAVANEGEEVGQRVVAPTRRQPVVTGAADEHVVARASSQHVVARAAREELDGCADVVVLSGLAVVGIAVVVRRDRL